MLVLTIRGLTISAFCHMIPVLTGFWLRPPSSPCYGSRLEPSPFTGGQSPFCSQKRPIFFRNIFALKCHEQFLRLPAALCLVLGVLIVSPALAQAPPPAFGPPPPAEQPSTANPNLRVKI